MFRDTREPEFVTSHVTHFVSLQCGNQKEKASIVDGRNYDKEPTF